MKLLPSYFEKSLKYICQMPNLDIKNRIRLPHLSSNQQFLVSIAVVLQIVCKVLFEYYVVAQIYQAYLEQWQLRSFARPNRRKITARAGSGSEPKCSTHVVQQKFICTTCTTYELFLYYMYYICMYYMYYIQIFDVLHVYYILALSRCQPCDFEVDLEDHFWLLVVSRV